MTILSEALVVAAFGVGLLLVGLHLLNLLARISKWYTAFVLGDAYDLVGAALRKSSAQSA